MAGNLPVVYSPHGTRTVVVGEKLPDKVRRLETECILVREDIDEISGQLQRFATDLQKLQGDRQFLISGGKLIWSIIKRLLWMVAAAALGWGSAKLTAFLHVFDLETHER